tara:strand:+ start:799 stop:1437 length:639 start_codon:yes stop_codon:yes gene_type:complete
MENGADMYAVNLYGLNVLHLAAQGDQPLSLYYFKSQHMDLYAPDKRLSTPLHWACFSNSEIALIYLLAWYRTDKLNLQDVDGYTPLHFTVKAADQLKSGRPLRALLMKGAIRDLKDKNDQTPFDLCEDLKSRKTCRELKDSLSQETYCDCLMLKSSLKKAERSLQLPITFLVLFDSIYALLMLFLFPVWESGTVVYLNLGFGLLTLLFWFWA